MASTQKKGNGRKKAPAPPPPPAYNAAARLVGGIVCALLALCVLVSYFNVDALLLTWIARVLRGALGWGYYLTAPALAAVAVIQLGHKGRPVILRTVCVAVLPLLIGVLCHLALCRTAYEFGDGLAGKLWADGQALRCGGVVAGGLAVGCEALLSKVVSIVVAPPTEIGASGPNQRAISGAPNRVSISRMMLAKRAMVPNLSLIHI